MAINKKRENTHVAFFFTILRKIAANRKKQAISFSHIGLQDKPDNREEETKMEKTVKTGRELSYEASTDKELFLEEKASEEKAERLFVANGRQNKALKNGAVFVRKDFFRKKSEGYFTVSHKEGMTGEKKSALISEFGRAAFEKKEEIKQLDEAWKEVLEKGDNLDALHLAKKRGLPHAHDVLEKMFQKWRTDDENEYQLNWKYLCDYLPEFEKRFGKEAFMSICNRHALVGDMLSAIEHERENMVSYEAEYLHFCYSHRKEKEV